MRLALFDLDNTLLAGDSDYEWGQFLIDRGILEREAYEAQNRAYFAQYAAGTLDIHEYLGFALRHLGRGDLCPIITATNSFVTAPIAREFRVPHLIATEPECRDGRFTGRVAGIPCFREGKVRRLKEWLGAQGRRLGEFAESAFYSDSHNDLPLLERVTRPVAVDPDGELAREAARRGWERISLRR